MAERPKNIVADLMDIRSRLSPVEGADTFQIKSELRLGKAEIDDPVGGIVAKRVHLRLEMDGYEICQENRLGEPVRTGSVAETKSVTHTVIKTAASGEAAGSLSTDGKASGSATGKVSGSAEAETRKETSVQARVERKFVKALGGDRWEVVDQENGHLDGTYITGSEPLCHVEKSKGANRSIVTVTGSVLKRELDFISDRIGFLSPNKNKVIKAFIVKRLGEATASDVERLVISSQEIGDE